ncbi:MAG: hypothetical protein P8M30_12990, partial [Planctomycetaceae bacterium]|nr:hypothetical protein [Planctomycetaceae bacterium]
LTPRCGESMAPDKPVVMTFKLPKIESPSGEPRTLTLVDHDPQDHFFDAKTPRHEESRRASFCNRVALDGLSASGRICLTRRRGDAEKKEVINAHQMALF